MVFLRVLFHVALGVVGVFPSLCSAAQQFFAALDQGPPWGPPATELEGHDAAGGRSDGAAAAAAAAARELRDASGVSDENRATGANAAAAAALKHHREQQKQKQEEEEEQQQSQQQQQKLDEGSDAASEGSISRRLDSPGDDVNGPSPGSMLMLPSADHFLSLGSLSQLETESSSIKKSEDVALEDSRGSGDGGFSFLSALTGSSGSSDGSDGEGPLDSFSAVFRAHPALAELFLHPPFRAQLPENPRQKRAVEVHRGRLTSAALTMCGRRDQDEDTLVVDAQPADSPLVIKALFDGHGGQFTSRFCSTHLHTFLQGMKSATPEAIRDAFLAMDAELLQGRQTQQSGSTGVVALIEELSEEREFLVSGREILRSPSSIPLSQKLDPEDRVGSYAGPPKRIRIGGPNNRAFLVTIANVGDSRATLFHSDGGFSVLSRDHKPTDPEELARIEKAGGYVTYSPMSVPRVDGILALSRAFGDGFFKDNKELGPQEQRVVAVPEVHSFYAQPGDVLMLACDGAYEPDNMNWVFVSHFMLTLIHELKNDLTEAGVKLLEHAYHSLSGDNISVLLTRFESEESDRKARRFQVTPEGHIVPESPSTDLGLHADGDIDQLKGSMKLTTENPITL